MERSSIDLPAESDASKLKSKSSESHIHMERSPSSSSDQVKDVDWISNLPNDALLMILSRLSTEEAIRTSLLSQRWEHVWKHMSHLILDMHDDDGSDQVATLLTKVINNHRGQLESCVIDHHSIHSVNGNLNAWIRALTCKNHTKVLTLTQHSEYYFGCLDLLNLNRFLNISPKVFSHPSLKSLSLTSYIFYSSRPLGYCPNLRTLKLSQILTSEVGVFNKVLASCPSLEVLVLHIKCFKKIGSLLMINNKKLKLLQVETCEYIDGIRVSATSLEILSIVRTDVRRKDFFLTAPQLKFNRNFWVTGSGSHISYSISKEEKSIGHEEFVNLSGDLLRGYESLSVRVDLMNPTEVERLRQVLSLWTLKMRELEIIFKDNKGPRGEESDSWKKNHYKDPFPNVEFCVDTVWMYNFSGSEEEFELASCLVRQGTVVSKMMIESTSFSPRKKLEIEAAVAKLQALQTEDQCELTIQCF